MAEAQAYTEGPPGNYNAPANNAAVGNTSEEILAANPDRICAIISNYGTVDVYIAVGQTAADNTGLYLAAGTGVLQIGGPAGLPLNKEAINGITVSGSGTVAVQEVVKN